MSHKSTSGDLRSKNPINAQAYIHMSMYTPIHDIERGIICHTSFSLCQSFPSAKCVMTDNSKPCLEA